MERLSVLVDSNRPVTERYQLCFEMAEELHQTASKDPDTRILEGALSELLDGLWNEMTAEQRSGFKSPSDIGVAG